MTSSKPGIEAAAAASGACHTGSLEARARPGFKHQIASHAAVGMMTSAHTERNSVPDVQHETRNDQRSDIFSSRAFLSE